MPPDSIFVNPDPQRYMQHKWDGDDFIIGGGVDIERIDGIVPPVANMVRHDKNTVVVFNAEPFYMETNPNCRHVYIQDSDVASAPEMEPEIITSLYTLNAQRFNVNRRDTIPSVIENEDIETGRHADNLGTFQRDKMRYCVPAHIVCVRSLGAIIAGGFVIVGLIGISSYFW